MDSFSLLAYLFSAKHNRALSISRNITFSCWLTLQHVWLVARLLCHWAVSEANCHTSESFEFDSSISSHHLSNHSQYCVYLPSIYGSQGPRSNWWGNGEFHTHIHKQRLIKKSLESSLSRVQRAAWTINDRDTLALAVGPKRCLSVC